MVNLINALENNNFANAERGNLEYKGGEMSWHYGHPGETGHNSDECYKYLGCSYGPINTKLDLILFELRQLKSMASPLKKGKIK